MPEAFVERDTRFFGHPRGLAILFFTEMWERFGYYGMRALLILFMTAKQENGGLGMDVGTAGVLYGLFTAMAYMSALPGGWIADRLIGQRRAVLIGGIFIAAGNLVIAVPDIRFFYSGLAIVVCGTGLLKPNVSAIVGQLYSPGDSRRDAGFSIFYMGINLGAFLSPLACGWAAYRFGWRSGFLLAGIGMALGVVHYLISCPSLGAAGLAPATPNDTAAKRQFRNAAIAGVGLLAAVLVASAFDLLTAKAFADASGVVLVAVVVFFFAWLLFGAHWSTDERRRLAVVLVLFLAACMFWSVFEQAGSSMNLFAQRNTDNNLAGIEIPAPWYQSINALFIIAFAPVFAALWVKLGRFEPSSPAKFAWGLALGGAGFLILAAGSTLAANGARVSPAWLLVTYLFHTCGELCLSPVGLSAITKLAPARVGGLMMGVWFLSISVGNYLGGRAASMYESLSLQSLFGVTGLCAILTAVILALFVRPIVRLMGGVR